MTLIKQQLKAKDIVLKEDFDCENLQELVAGTGVTLVTTRLSETEFKTVATMAAKTLAVASADKGAGWALATFPKGILDVSHIEGTVTISGTTNSSDTPEVGIGTTVASGAIAVLSGTATLEDTLDSVVATAITIAGAVTTIPLTAGESDLKDGRSTAITLYLNIADTWTVTENNTIVANLTFYWKLLK